MPRVDNDLFYATSLATHGESAEGVQWNSRQSQQRRFEVLRELLPDDLTGIDLVDAGCGLGDFLLFLRERGDCPRHYRGLDAMPRMVELARARTGCEIALCDILAEPLPSADYYLCSGAMNTLTPEESDRFIANCFAASRRAFVFNLLHGWDTSPIYNYRMPGEVQALAARLGAGCEIVDGYLARDFSVRLRRLDDTAT